MQLNLDSHDRRTTPFPTRGTHVGLAVSVARGTRQYQNERKGLMTGSLGAQYRRRRWMPSLHYGFWRSPRVQEVWLIASKIKRPQVQRGSRRENDKLPSILDIVEVFVMLLLRILSMAKLQDSLFKGCNLRCHPGEGWQDNQEITVRFYLFLNKRYATFTHLEHLPNKHHTFA